MARSKTYGMPFMMEASVLIPLNGGRAHLRVQFKGGIPTEEGEMPAKFTTDDAAVQQIIENSEYYGRSIYLYGSNGDKLSGFTPEFDYATAEPKEYPNVRTFADLGQQLLEMGAKLHEIQTKDKKLSTAKRFNMILPNLDPKSK